MKTQMIMTRQLGNFEVRQNHKTEMFNVNDLITAGNKAGKLKGRNKKILANYFTTDTYKEFEQALIWDGMTTDEIKTTKTGANGGTWVCPLLLVDVAMWISPEFKVQALKWIIDGLVRSRDESGESFKQMNIDLRLNYGKEMQEVIVYKKISNHIATACGVGVGKNKWQDASEEQLKKRDDIHKAISMFAGEKDTLANCVMTVIKKFKPVKKTDLKSIEE